MKLKEVTKFKIDYSHDNGKSWQPHMAGMTYDEAMTAATRLDYNQGVKYRVGVDTYSHNLPQFNKECSRCHRSLPAEIYLVQTARGDLWRNQFEQLMTHAEAHRVLEQCRKYSPRARFRVGVIVS